MLSLTEENYLKTIYHLSEQGSIEASTNSIAENLQTKPASVTDMLRKLAQKNLINYIKYQGVTLTESGVFEALKVVRKHRLWEVFLVDKLRFNWDEVHEIAEQLEHINSTHLIEKLDEFLGFPKFDPHGDPIPNSLGVIEKAKALPLSELHERSKGVLSGVKDTSPSFLQYLDKIGVKIGSVIEVVEKITYDQSIEISIDDARNITISREVSQNILISR